MEFNVMGIDVAIMNNTPIHFGVATVMLLLFARGAFFASEAQKPLVLKIMYCWFVLLLISGCAVWALVDIDDKLVPLLVKSLGGILLFWVLTEIVKKPASKLFWSLFVAIAAVGLSVAFTQI